MLNPVQGLNKTTCVLHGLTQAQRVKVSQAIADAFPDAEVFEDVVETYTSLDCQPVFKFEQIGDNKYSLHFYRL